MLKICVISISLTIFSPAESVGFETSLNRTSP